MFSVSGKITARKPLRSLSLRMVGWIDRRDRGSKGCLFDGISNISFDSPVVHIELGRIADTDKQLKAVAGFIVSNYIRQKVQVQKEQAKLRQGMKKHFESFKLPNRPALFKPSK